MMKNSNTKLLSYILEKERKEKAAKKRKIILAISMVLLLCAAGIFYYQHGNKNKLPQKPVYSSNELSLQGVVRLLTEDPNGILIRNPLTDRIDTLYTLDEYKFLAGMAPRPKTRRAPQLVLNESRELESIETPAFDPEIDRVKREVQMASQKVSADEPVVAADIMPSYPGGEAALYQFLSKQIRYPRQAVKNKTEGTVYVRFVIQPSGKISSPEVMRGIGSGCDEEALRVISSMPPWNPGEVMGQKVPVFSSLAVNFKFL